MTTTLEGPTSEQVRFIAFGPLERTLLIHHKLGLKIQTWKKMILQTGHSYYTARTISLLLLQKIYKAFDVDATSARDTIQPKQLQGPNV